MVNSRGKDQQKELGSPRAGEVGEIDTSAPIPSVKAAVSLFGEVAVSRGRTRYFKPKSSESVLEKETELQVALRELSQIKQQLESAETAKNTALCELQKAKITLEDLTANLTSVRESKESAIEAAKALKNQAKQPQSAISQEAWRDELEQAREDHATTVTEIEAAREELARIKKDFDAALEAKMAALQKAEEAQREAKVKSERVRELSEEIAAMKEEQVKVMADKEEQLDAVKKKLGCLKEEYDPEMTQNLKAKLAETSAEIDVLQEEMRKAHAFEMDTVRHVTSELVEAMKTLEDVAEEESFLRNQVASLKTELEQVKKEGKTVEVEVNDDEQSLKIQQLAVETKEARREAEEMSRKAQELKQEAEKARAVTEEVERKLELLKKEAEEAKAAEQRAIEEMKTLSEFNGNKIKLPAEMFESLSGKVKEYQDLVEKTEAASLALVEAIRTRKEETDKKVEASLKEIEGIKHETDVALRDAETADSAKMALEAVLLRWRQTKQNEADNVYNEKH